jgi:hypothetical protein
VTIDTQNATIKAYKDLMDAMKTKMEAGMPVTPDDRNLVLKQQDIMEEAQQVIDEGPNKEQAASLMQDQALAGQQIPEVDNARRLTVEQPSTSIGQDNL